MAQNFHPVGVICLLTRRRDWCMESTHAFRVYRRRCRGCDLRLHVNTPVERRLALCSRCGAWLHGVYGLRLLLLIAVTLIVLRLGVLALEHLAQIARRL